ncbi:MAG TPA: hypothetical protein VFH30_08945 [Acidimicrobiales bacterium]|nr:hypothetical protein [Acidimicrobiales bacterium]
MEHKITRAGHRVAELESDARFRHRWLTQHPDLARRIEHTQRELRRLDDPIGVELLERVEALAPEPPVTSPHLERTDIARLRAHLDRLQQTRDIEPPGLSL